MKRISFLGLAALSLLVYSCNVQEAEPQFKEVTITASVENGTETRSVVDCEKFLWAKGDAIGVWTGSRFTEFTLEGEGGQTSGTFSAVLVGDEAATAIAVYPHGGHVYADGAIAVNYPATYGGPAETYAANTNAVMVSIPETACVDESEPLEMVFQHVGGVIEITVHNLPNEATGVKLTTDKVITGQFDLVDGQAKASEEGEGKSVTIKFAASETARGIQKFYFPVPVGTYSSLELGYYEGETYKEIITAATTNTVDRTTLLAMPAVKFSEVNGDTEPGFKDEEASLRSAFELATESGSTYVLTKDVDLASGLILPDGKKLTLDLNGHAINSDFSGVTDNVSTATITVRKGAELIITGNGEINTVAANANTAQDNKVSAMINNLGGSVTIENGKFTHVRGTNNVGSQNYLPALVDVNSTTGVAELVVNGGEFVVEKGEATSCGRVFRTFSNNNTQAADITINGGKFSSETLTYIQNQLGGPGTIEVNGGTFENVTFFDFNADTKYTNEKIKLNGGTFSDLWYTTYYLTESSKITVKLEEDYSVETDQYVIPSGAELTLNLNGHTISGEADCTGHYCMIQNNGSLRITGNGTIDFTDTGNGGGTSWGAYTIGTVGTLVIESGTISNSTDNAGTYYAVNQTGGTVEINGGKISSTGQYGRSVRIFANGEMTINGGTFEGQVWAQGANADGNITLNITGGEFTPKVGYDGSSVFVGNAGSYYDVVAFSVTGGKFNTKIGANNPDSDKVKGKITGGIFTSEAKAAMESGNLNKNLIASNASFVDNGDGTYTLSLDVD